jgi:hypothetical protein
MVYSWTRYGRGYECSSKGDTRFSALYAKLRDGRTIEAHYQCDVKGYEPGGTNWKLGKGKPPKDSSTDLWSAYLILWYWWAIDHESDLTNLRQLVIPYNGVLRDSFAKTHVNQAHALAIILNGPFYIPTTVVNTRKGQPYDISIERPSCWGNPYIMGVHGSREEVIALYEHDVRADPAFMLKIKRELRGKRLGCCCKPKACHGDILAAIADKN